MFIPIVLFEFPQMWLSQVNASMGHKSLLSGCESVVFADTEPDFLANFISKAVRHRRMRTSLELICRLCVCVCERVRREAGQYEDYCF